MSGTWDEVLVSCWSLDKQEQSCARRKAPAVSSWQNHIWAPLLADGQSTCDGLLPLWLFRSWELHDVNPTEMSFNMMDCSNKHLSASNYLLHFHDELGKLESWPLLLISN